MSEVVRTTKFWTPQEFRYKYICCGSTLPHLLDRFQLELSAVPDDRLDEFIEDKRKMVKYIDEVRFSACPWSSSWLTSPPARTSLF